MKKIAVVMISIVGVIATLVAGIYIGKTTRNNEVAELQAQYEEVYDKLVEAESARDKAEAKVVEDESRIDELEEGIFNMMNGDAYDIQIKTKVDDNTTVTDHYYNETGKWYDDQHDTITVSCSLVGFN